MCAIILQFVDTTGLLHQLWFQEKTKEELTAAIPAGPGTLSVITLGADGSLGITSSDENARRPLGVGRADKAGRTAEAAKRRDIVMERVYSQDLSSANELQRTVRIEG